MLGGDGANILTGSAYDDTITGGTGTDTIAGGAGADVLTGGLGNDIFNYTSLATVAAQTGITLATSDTIDDFLTGFDTIKMGTAGAGNYSSAALPLPSLRLWQQQTAVDLLGMITT